MSGEVPRDFLHNFPLGARLLKTQTPDTMKMQESMKRNPNRHIITHTIIFLGYLLFGSADAFACTIASGVAADGQVWNANNEDGPHGIANFINVFPGSGNEQYGYFTLSYLSPKYGEGGNMQGGMNETGLTFDFNAIRRVEDFDSESKATFPDGDDAILPHILATMDSVEEVIRFFEKYWFQNGFRSAQMHVADRQGRFAIISASGILLVEKGQPLVSTNFDICGKEDGSSCWRYPIATSRLASLGVSLSTMTSICRETAQKNGGTMYSNIQNLTTGDVWFVSKHDPNTTVNVNIADMLARGRRSYTLSDLNSLVEDRPEQQTSPETIALAEDLIKEYTGIYRNPLIGKITIQKHQNGIKVSSVQGSAVFYPQANNMFYLPGENVSLEFVDDEKEGGMAMNYIENGFWSFTVWRDLPDKGKP